MTSSENREIPSKPITKWLVAWRNGDEAALEKLIPMVYEELHALAARKMRHEKAGHILQTTALVNEAYCKLVQQREVRWENRAHFFAIASRLMRRILLDHARKRSRSKRGGRTLTISISENTIFHTEQSPDLIALDEALNQLGEVDPQKCKIVEMKFFGGLTNEEIAQVEQVSLSTINREWRKARAWLIDMLRQ
jgi:RNA polymerase sigma factor (TIGR02999 family)